MQATSQDRDVFAEATMFLRNKGLLTDASFDMAYRLVGWYAANAHLVVSISGGEISGVCLARQINRKDFDKKSFTNNPEGDTMWISQMATSDKSAMKVFISQMLLRLIDGKIKSMPQYIGWERDCSGNNKFHEVERFTRILRNI